MCEHESTKDAKSGINLAIMSGPDDGEVFRITQEQFAVGNSPEAQIQIDYDPDLPPEGITICVNGSEVALEDGSAGNREIKKFGEVFLLGQTWVAVYRETERQEG